ncbi:MAG: VWA domain-containing protein [Bacteroidota bacterium]
MFRFAHPEYLYAFLLIPALLLVFIFGMHWKRKALRRYGDWQVVKQLLPDKAFWRQSLKFGILMLVLSCLILAVARPQLGSRLEKGERKGIDLFICVDVSNSMMAQDIQPDRLSRAKNAVSKMIDELKNDRIGLVVFAGKAYVQLPITADYAAAKMFLGTITPGMIPSQGTSIGEAINLAVTSFGESKHNKAIILITDGENHEDDAIAAAKDASSKGIKIFTVGMGLPEGAPIPVYNGSIMAGYKKDNAGNTIITKLDDVLLQQIASAGQGAYVRANNTQQSLEKIFKEIDRMQKSEFEAKIFSDYEDRYQYPLGAALFLMILEMLILERRNKLLSRIKLFS